jgi:hypothetical protein
MTRSPYNYKTPIYKQRKHHWTKSEKTIKKYRIRSTRS